MRDDSRIHRIIVDVLLLAITTLLYLILQELRSRPISVPLQSASTDAAIIVFTV